jgi:large subunit ribosomal protein L22
MAIKYSFKNMNDNMTKALGRDLSISTKQSVEICKNIRGKSVEQAKKLLERVIVKETPIRMRRYIKDTAHKKGIGPGKYPVKAAKEILRLLKIAESNAQNKGLSTNEMVITHISANKASRPWHFGRQRRRKNKRTHVEVVLFERKKQEKVQQKKTENLDKGVQKIEQDKNKNTGKTKQETKK